MVKELKSSSNSTTQPNNTRWIDTVFSVFTKNYLLLLAFLLLSDMILRLLLATNYDRRIDELSQSLLQLQMTTNSIQIEVEAVDRKLEKQVNHLRNELCERIDKNDLHVLSGEWIRKDELNEFLKKFQFNNDQVEEIVNREIEKHAADGIGRVDYAVESGGAMVVKHSKPYDNRKQRFTQDEIHVDAHKIIQPSFGEPGQCFGLKGNNGFVQIRLRQAIIPEAITLEHIAKSVAYDRTSAPKDCRVFGWFHNPKANDVQMMVLLAYFSYDIEKSNVQTFTVFDKDPFLPLVNMIRLDFTSNHGNPAYTCIYRIRVHGHKPESLAAAKIPLHRMNDSTKGMMILQ